MNIVGMIPARLESRRLPRKALVDIEGLPMVVHTCLRARMAKNLDRVFLVTDNEEIRKAGEKHGIDVIMTGTHHRTGSDRLAEACRSMDCDIVVNVQGDEPLVDPEHIDAIVAPLIADPSVSVAVGVTLFTKKNSPSDIKAVLDLKGNIMYCSRTDLPGDARTPVHEMWKMSFIVPFRKEVLLSFSSWKPTPLEEIEFNEYLRLLEHGVSIRAVKIEDAKISVDTAEDLAEIRQLMQQDPLRKCYLRSDAGDP